jgi:choline kinase
VRVALLAAGLGSRLGALTAELPKALVMVGGEPLVAHALRFASALAPREIVVVGGFQFPLLASVIDRQRERPDRPPIQLVENPQFREGNLLSLTAARPWLTEDFVLLNVDHIFRPAIAPLVAAEVDEVTAFIDTDRTLGADDMKVERDAGGRLRAIAKTLTLFDAGYVGITRVPGPALARYWDAAEAALAEEGRAIPVERVLARLAGSSAPPRCRDVSGRGWLEVDTPEERGAAERALRGPGWR